MGSRVGVGREDDQAPYIYFLVAVATWYSHKVYEIPFDKSGHILLLLLAGYMVTNTVLSRYELLWEVVKHFDKQPTLYPIHQLGLDSSPLLNSIGVGGRACYRRI